MFTDMTAPMFFFQDLLSYAAILIPPMIVDAIDPTIFLPALEYAGTFGICVLFGIFPAVMAHITRRKQLGDKEYVQMVPGKCDVSEGYMTVALLLAPVVMLNLYV